MTCETVNNTVSILLKMYITKVALKKTVAVNYLHDRETDLLLYAKLVSWQFSRAFDSYTGLIQASKWFRLGQPTLGRPRKADNLHTPYSIRSITFVQPDSLACSRMLLMTTSVWQLTPRSGCFQSWWKFNSIYSFLKIQTYWYRELNVLSLGLICNFKAHEDMGKQN